METFNRIIDRIEQVAIFVASLTLGLMALYIFFDVMGRYLFNRPIPGAFEITEDYLMVIAIFLAFSYTFTKNGHVSVELFTQFMSVRMKKVISKVVHLIGLVYIFLMTWQTYKQTIYTFTSGSLSRSSMAYILWPAFGVAFLGSALLCIRLFQALLTSKKTDHEEGAA